MNEPAIRPSVEFARHDRSLTGWNSPPFVPVVRAPIRIKDLLTFLVCDPHQARMHVTDRQLDTLAIYPVARHAQPEDHLARVVDDESKHLSIVKAEDSAPLGQKSQCGRETRPESVGVLDSRFIEFAPCIFVELAFLPFARVEAHQAPLRHRAKDSAVSRRTRKRWAADHPPLARRTTTGISGGEPGLGCHGAVPA